MYTTHAYTHQVCVWSYQNVSRDLSPNVTQMLDDFVSNAKTAQGIDRRQWSVSQQALACKIVAWARKLKMPQIKHWTNRADKDSSYQHGTLAVHTHRSLSTRTWTVHECALSDSVSEWVSLIADQVQPIGELTNPSRVSVAGFIVVRCFSSVLPSVAGYCL